ncbi:hypothetical protein BU16DRAFT_454522 [Lophium mytilinum]|uniref:Uncharacterized protein n=1 Tax=Lophium mytilinum TaxID=390894 RepID=A0A6A6R3B0_9PEZI|nr:hypothetical protein BU16DRAFT_454522 [Lophium mytilinum]
MWPDGPNYAEVATLENRERELLADDRLFGALVAEGANVYRHNEKGHRDHFEETASARRIITHLIRQSDMRAPEVLRLQREIIDQGKSLGETAAGIAVAGDLYRARRAHERQLREIETELKGQMAKADAAHATELRELKADVEKQLRKAKEEKRALQKTMQDMHEEEERAWMKNIEALDRRFRDQLAEKEEELQEMEESLREIRDDMARQAQKTHQQQLAVREAVKLARQSQKAHQQQLALLEAVKHEKIVRKARNEVFQARSAYEKFHGQRDNILNGTANGLAAGATTAIIAGKLALPAVLSSHSSIEIKVTNAKLSSSDGWWTPMCGDVEE